MKLVFQASDGEERTIADVKDDDEAMYRIKEFCKERNFSIPYIRSWTDEDNTTWIDVSSWSEFFKLYKDN